MAPPREPLPPGVGAGLNLRLFDHPYAEFLDRLEKPTRYVGREHGAVRKDWSRVAARVCLAFPDLYDIGMSHLGYRILYHRLNEAPDTLAERCYAPWFDLTAELRQRGIPLVSLETRRPLCEFDVVGFSLQFELCHTNLLAMLELGRIPLRSVDRSEDAPLVLAGGPAASHPEPVAPFFDAVLVGDGEEAAGEIALEWVRAKREGLSRLERLERLAGLRGVYVPSLYPTHPDPDTGFLVVDPPTKGNLPYPVVRRVIEDIDVFPFPIQGPVGGPEAVFDRTSIEIARGCGEGCRFCQAGMVYRPVRERPPDQVFQAVCSAIETNGQDEISLTALSTADVSYITPLVKALSRRTAPERVSLGVASLRAYGLEPELLDQLRQVRVSGLTFAPEAGTQRLRNVINKNVTEEQLLETAERVFSRGWERMKLYFILGLPTETDPDVLGISEVARRALEVGRRVSKRRITVTVSASVHVPKPHTPFQWCEMVSLAELSRKQALLQQALRGTRGLELRLHDPAASLLEALLARGDRRAADVIEHAYRAGALFDSWQDRFRPELWEAAWDASGIDRGAWLGPLPLSARLPWDHIDVGLVPEFLRGEYQKALLAQPTLPCSKPVARSVSSGDSEVSEPVASKLVCHDCGVGCDLRRLREQRSSHLARIPEPDNEAPGPSAPGPSAIPLPSPEQHRPVRSGGAPLRWRLRFRKVGPAALLGHLDLIRELPRTFRRAGLRVAYTKGYHPRPNLSFGPALALGVASLDEYVDATLLGAPDADQLLVQLGAAAPEGLDFQAAVVLDGQAPRLAHCIKAARYALAIPETEIAARTQTSELATQIEHWLKREHALVDRPIDGHAKPIDVRSFVQSLQLDTPPSREAVELAGILGEYRTIEACVVIEPRGSAKATEIVESLFEEPVPCRTVRMALLSDNGVPLAETAGLAGPAAGPQELVLPRGV